MAKLVSKMTLFATELTGQAVMKINRQEIQKFIKELYKISG
jgi:hypothetical protein